MRCRIEVRRAAAIAVRSPKREFKRLTVVLVALSYCGL